MADAHSFLADLVPKNFRCPKIVLASIADVGIVAGLTAVLSTRTAASQISGYRSSIMGGAEHVHDHFGASAPSR